MAIENGEIPNSTKYSKKLSHDNESLKDKNLSLKTGDSCRKRRRLETPMCSKAKKLHCSKELTPSDNKLTVDREGYLMLNPGVILHQRYETVVVLGEGSFGRVASCRDLKNDSKLVAVKVSRDSGDIATAAVAEANLLRKIAKWDPEGKVRCLRLLDEFKVLNHTCLVTPLLGPSVYDFLKGNNYVPYPMRHIRHIAKQILETVKFLHERDVIHTDLKPENILFLSGEAESRYSKSAGRDIYILKSADICLIDFGSAVCRGDARPVTISTRHYRAPEVVLEIKWGRSADMWSIACILLELFTGDCIFMTHSRLEHLAMMERLIGIIPGKMVKSTPREEYFCRGRLDWDKSSRNGRKVREMVLPLDDYRPDRPTSTEQDFFDLLSKLLVYDGNNRLTAAEALEHKFVIS